MALASDLARIKGRMELISKKKPTFRGCIYGNSGCGKTVLAAQIMKQIISPGKGIIYIDTSEGWVSINNIPGLADGIMYIPFETIEDVRVIVSAIKQKQDVFAFIGGIILDEASTMAAIDLDRVFEQRGGEDLTPTWPDYHAALARFRIMMAELFDVPDLHVILLAHVAEKKDAKGNTSQTFPSFSPKTAAKVKEPLHLVGYMQAGVKPAGPDGTPNYERNVQVHPTLKLDAKTRLPIRQVRVLADELPLIIRDWIMSGGKEEILDSTPREDIEPPEEFTTQVSSDRLLELVDTEEPEFEPFEPITGD